MTPLPVFPIEVHQFVKKIFAQANVRLSEKIARVPNCPEPSLDLTLIEHLSQFGAAQVVAPGWAVRIDVHYLGGMRHYFDWEIADIGVLLFAKKHGSTIASKVALLQSKRLYPAQHGVIEESISDFHIGFAKLLPGAAKTASIASPHQFNFNTNSKYKALVNQDMQFDAISAYESQSKIPVHYLLYNPWTVPVTYNLPLKSSVQIGARSNGGARVVPYEKLKDLLKTKPKGYQPTFQDLKTVISSASIASNGWRLEHFISNLMMKCKEGYLFSGLADQSIDSLFNRRSGPISAAISVTVEQYEER
jgi:hypothetical protein